MKSWCTSYPDADLVEAMILDTKDHSKPASSVLSDLFLGFDLHGLCNGTLNRMISDEKKMFREYGYVDYGVYQTTRAKILESFAPHIKKRNPESKIDEYVDWFKNRKAKIGFYVGSFYPFHRGHLDILQKAERTFDKVVILLADNPAKKIPKVDRESYAAELQKKLPNNQIEISDIMLHKLLKNLPYPVTIVKGLRNASDFDAEKLQLRYMEDMDENINVVYIVGDRKYEHISSSGVKAVQSFDPSEAEKYLF